MDVFEHTDGVWEIVYGRRGTAGEALMGRSRRVGATVTELRQQISAFSEKARNALDAPDGTFP
ncbi:hypothetical protein [Streptomyces sp. CT34]|uniref:hypothetical protein n=1 Tax=Streptomyces sp. CT34 TaxID=1553907 RepID=UPI0012FEDB36|nr:hypothetical protein [Streptomyces sp. CT34]